MVSLISIKEYETKRKKYAHTIYLSGDKGANELKEEKCVEKKRKRQ